MGKLGVNSLGLCRKGRMRAGQVENALNVDPFQGDSVSDEPLDSLQARMQRIKACADTPGAIGPSSDNH